MSVKRVLEAMKGLGLVCNADEEGAWRTFLTIGDLHFHDIGIPDAVNALGPGRTRFAQHTGDVNWDYANSCVTLGLLLGNRLHLLPKGTARALRKGFDYAAETALQERPNFALAYDWLKRLTA